MKLILIIFVIFTAPFQTNGQNQPRKKSYNPNINFPQKNTLVVSNNKIYDINSVEAKQILKKLKQYDATKNVIIINDFNSKSKVKQIIYITNKIN